MKRLIILMAFGVAMAQVGCGGGGDLASCVSSYDGSLDGIVMAAGEREGGPIYGPLIARLTIDTSPGIPDDEREGTLTVLLEDLGEPDEDKDPFRSGEMTVAPDGTLTPRDMTSLPLMGTFDFDNCSVSGDFAIGTSASGTWELGLYEGGLF